MTVQPLQGRDPDRRPGHRVYGIPTVPDRYRGNFLLVRRGLGRHFVLVDVLLLHEQVRTRNDGDNRYRNDAIARPVRGPRTIESRNERIRIP